MVRWTKEAIECYKRHIVAGMYSSNPCKTLINNKNCRNNKSECEMFKKVQELYFELGSPINLSVEEIILKDYKPQYEKPVKYSANEELIIKALSEQPKAINRNKIADLTGINLSSISTTISKINQKTSNIVLIEKDTHNRSYYKLNNKVLINE